MDFVEKFIMICIFLVFINGIIVWINCKEIFRKIMWNIEKIKEKRII